MKAYTLSFEEIDVNITFYSESEEEAINYFNLVVKYSDRKKISIIKHLAKTETDILKALKEC